MVEPTCVTLTLMRSPALNLTGLLETAVPPDEATEDTLLATDAYEKVVVEPTTVIAKVPLNWWPTPTTVTMSPTL